MRLLVGDERDFPKYSASKKFLEERSRAEDRALANNDSDATRHKVYERPANSDEKRSSLRPE